MRRVERKPDQGLVLTPRSNRPRTPRGARPAVDQDRDDDEFSRILESRHRTETRRGVVWRVQAVSGATAIKDYVCPGCPVPIVKGQAHVVAWRAAGVTGDEADIAGRRHWHTHCWKIS